MQQYAVNVDELFNVLYRGLTGGQLFADHEVNTISERHTDSSEYSVQTYNTISEKIMQKSYNR